LFWFSAFIFLYHFCFIWQIHEFITWFTAYLDKAPADLMHTSPPIHVSEDRTADNSSYTATCDQTEAERRTRGTTVSVFNGKRASLNPAKPSLTAVRSCSVYDIAWLAHTHAVGKVRLARVSERSRQRKNCPSLMPMTHAQESAKKNY